ncbi:MAG: DUF3566 domain-containing protein [Elusimicrobiota bacterium]
MEIKELKSISVVSVAKSAPIVFFILGMVVGIASYVYLKVNPATVAPRINFWEWVLAILLYAVIFCVILSLLAIVGSFLYNILSKKIGGIKVQLDNQQNAE